jgi:hypothetical protein
VQEPKLPDPIGGGKAVKKKRQRKSLLIGSARPQIACPLAFSRSGLAPRVWDRQLGARAWDRVIGRPRVPGDRLSRRCLAIDFPARAWRLAPWASPLALSGCSPSPGKLCPAPGLDVPAVPGPARPHARPAPRSPARSLACRALARVLP